MTRWKMPTTLAQAKKVQVFSGGACNIRDKKGGLLRNYERDSINDWLTEKGVTFYDPQIHPDTHQCEYDYELHHPMELAARKAAAINLYEISPRTFGGVTSLELAIDQVRVDKPTVIFFSDGSAHKDVIPAHSSDGFPLFAPFGIRSAAARQAHYEELKKNARHMRQYVMRFAEDVHGLTVTFNDRIFQGDIVISPQRMHAEDLFRAVVQAVVGKRVVVNFTGGPEARDEKGYPLFMTQNEPKEMEIRAMLDQYTDEGNALRRAICELVRINVFVRVVYTQRAAIDALNDLLHLKGLM